MPAPAASFGGSETILVVDDDPQLRRLMTCVLRSYGYVVLEAAAGSEALHLAQRHAGRLSLVVSDVELPGISGFDLATRLLAQRGDPIKVLLFSGHGTEVMPQGLLERGVAFLQKPVFPKQLAGRVREILDAPPAG